MGCSNRPRVWISFLASDCSSRLSRSLPPCLFIFSTSTLPVTLCTTRNTSPKKPAPSFSLWSKSSSRYSSVKAILSASQEGDLDRTVSTAPNQEADYLPRAGEAASAFLAAAMAARAGRSEVWYSTVQHITTSQSISHNHYRSYAETLQLPPNSAAASSSPQRRGGPLIQSAGLPGQERLQTSSVLSVLCTMMVGNTEQSGTVVAINDPGVLSSL